jgi:hypothetical protein
MKIDQLFLTERNLFQPSYGYLPVSRKAGKHSKTLAIFLSSYLLLPGKQFFSARLFKAILRLK